MEKIEIQKRNGVKRWVVGDIHGCLKTFKNLLENQIQFTKEDELYLLGDYIDRGPDSKGVLDYIIDLQEKGFCVYALRGNHEQYLLDALKEYSAEQVKLYVNKILKSNVLNDEGELPMKYYDFFQKLPYHIELDTCHLIHAGFNFRKENPLEDYQSMLSVRYQKDYSIEYERFTAKFVIHGHQPAALEKIQEAVLLRKKIIPLDNGCVYAAKSSHKILPIEKLGNLCALNIDTFELIIQENIDIKKEA